LDKLIEKANKIGDKSFKCAQIEKERIVKMIDLNLSRERKTYSKMFNPKKSVADYVKKKDEKESDKIIIKNSEEKELEAELNVIENEVYDMVKDKMSDFSFEIKPDWKTAYFPEISDI